jgi:hypothetical protein
MAVIGQDALTLMEIANARGPDGNFLTVAEVLTTMEEFWEGARWTPANGDMVHNWTRRGNEPAGSWSRFNKGVQKSVSSLLPGKDELAMLEDYSYVDERIIKNAAAGQKEAVRSRQDVAFLAGMSKEAISKIFYGNRGTDVDTIWGLSNKASHNAIADTYVYNGGGTETGTTQSSIWLLEWGTEKVTLTHPPANPTSMVESDDLGLQLIEDTDGNPYTAWVTHFYFNVGLSLVAEQAAQRVVNVSAALTSYEETINAAVKAINWLPMSGTNAYMYMNRYQRANFLIEAKDLTNTHYLQPGDDNPWNRRFLTTFLNVPINITEQLVQTEALVTA